MRANYTLAESVILGIILTVTYLVYRRDTHIATIYDKLEKLQIDQA